MSNESKLAKNTVIISIGHICTKGVSFLLIPLYTSLLSTEEYGTVDVITTYTSLLTILLTLQLEQGIFRFLVEARGDYKKQKEYVSTVFATLVLLLVLVILLGQVVLGNSNYPYADFLLINVVVSVVNAVVLQVPRGLGNNVAYVIGSFVNGASNVVLNVIFIAVLGWGLNGMLLAGLLSMLLCIFFVVYMTRLYCYMDISFFTLDACRELIAYSLPLIPYTMCFWVISASDRVIINMTIGIAYNGIYALGNKFSSMFTMVSNVFQTAWMESAFETIQNADRNKYYTTIVNNAVRFYSSCNIAIIAFLPIVFDFFVDGSFRDAYYYVPLLTTAAMFHAISSIYGAIYLALKKTQKVALLTMSAAVVNILFNICFINHIGLFAAAGSTCLAYAFMAIMRYIDMKRLIGIAIDKAFFLQEVLIYILVFCGYYSNNTLVQIVLLCCLAPYVVANNKTLLTNLFVKVRKLMRNGK